MTFDLRTLPQSPSNSLNFFELRKRLQLQQVLVNKQLLGVVTTLSAIPNDMNGIYLITTTAPDADIVFQVDDNNYQVPAYPGDTLVHAVTEELWYYDNNFNWNVTFLKGTSLLTSSTSILKTENIIPTTSPINSYSYTGIAKGGILFRNLKTTGVSITIPSNPTFTIAANTSLLRVII